MLHKVSPASAFSEMQLAMVVIAIPRSGFFSAMLISLLQYRKYYRALILEVQERVRV